MVHLSTRAVRIHRTGGPEVLTVEDAPLEPLQPLQVRIVMEAAGVSYPDLLQRSGALPTATLPHKLGFEVAGTIEAMGEAIRDPELALGTRVVAELHRGGGYAHRVNADVASVTRLPPKLRFEDAVAIVITGRTALLMLRHARVSEADSVFIPAALGGVGSFAVRLAKRLGARVIAGVGGDGKHQAALALGADAAVTYSRAGWSDEVRRNTDGKGADVVFQSAGGAVGTESLRALAPWGRLVMFGADNVVHPEPVSAEQVRTLVAQGQSLGGFAFLRTRVEERRAAFTELAELVASGKLPISIERFPLSRAEAAHTAMEARRTVGKIVLTPDTALETIPSN